MSGYGWFDGTPVPIEWPTEGELTDGTLVLTCPICYSLVSYMRVHEHRAWHDEGCKQPQT